MRSDAELLVAARADAGAFRELYDRYAARIHGYHLRRCRDSHAAHDLTAETFAQAWLSRARFRDEARGSAGPWLFGIARHVLLVSVRQQRLERSAAERLGVLDATDRVPPRPPTRPGSTVSTRPSPTCPTPSSVQSSCASSTTSATTRPPSSWRRRPRPCAHACRAASAPCASTFPTPRR